MPSSLVRPLLSLPTKNEFVENAEKKTPKRNSEKTENHETYSHVMRQFSMLLHDISVCTESN